MTPAWIALDHAPGRLRLWAIGADGAVFDQAVAQDFHGTRGAGVEATIAQVIAPWRSGEEAIEIIGCGPPPARNGQQHNALRAVPCAALAVPAIAVATRVPGLSLRFVAGLRQARPEPDLMQGDETRVAGVLSVLEGFDGVICLPGRHSRWVQVSAGEVVSFQSFLSGEIFEDQARAAGLSADASAGGGDISQDWDSERFSEALASVLSRPERLAARLHALRAARLLDGEPDTVTRARLWGALIGAELAGARAYWLGQRVMVVGTPARAAIYAHALAQQGLEAETFDEVRATLNGLVAARALAATAA